MKNKYQEALEELCSRCYVESEKCTCHARYKGGKCNNNCEYRQTLQELINKEEIPMKVDKTTIRKEDMTGEGYYFLPFACCPNCKRDVFEDDEYCPHCGQRLDWSDDDE